MYLSRYKVEDRTFRQFPFSAELLRNFLLGKNLQFAHVVLRTFHYSDREIHHSVGRKLGIRYGQEINEAI
jgi:hypothetical protein